MVEMKTMTVGSNTYEIVDETARAQVAAIEIPENISELANDAGYLTEETDPTVPDWAKASSKPSYTKSEVGLGNVDNVKQYSASNPPPYPVTSINGQTGDVSLTIPTVPTKITAFTNDAGYITSIPSEYVTETELAAKKYLTSVPSEYVTETELAAKGYITDYTEKDPTVPAWAKATNKPSYTKSEVGLGNVDNVKQYSANNPPPYPVTSVNGQTGAVEFTPSSLMAVSYDDGEPQRLTAAQKDMARRNIGAVPDSRTVNGKELFNDITLSAADVGAATLEEGTIYVEGSGTTDSTAKTSTWVGTSSRITSYYDGLAIRYKIGVAGQSTVTLNINGLGEKTVYRFGTTKLTTQFPVGSIITLIYHEDLNDGCWVTNDYDANTNTYQRVYATTTNAEYPITARYATTTGASYYAEYGRYTEDVTLNPSTGTITANKFKGNLDGTAAFAYADADGLNFSTMYARKSEIPTTATEVNALPKSCTVNGKLLSTNPTLTYEDLFLSIDEWVFTLEDGSTVTKRVMVKEGVSNDPV